MKRIVLVDGNNLLFRSYYATAYQGNTMSNSKGFPTNALYGFVNMINKIVKEEKPEYMMVAFDKGKTFRHDKYLEYKEGRIEMPTELKQQFPVAKHILTSMGIKYLEADNYEADDIIGTYSEIIDKSEDCTGLIVSSDKDLLQLITDKVTVKLLKPKDYIKMDPSLFKETYGINPINMIDLKALMGDSSDNIKGVKGIGEKTALKLLQEYQTLENIYENIDLIKGSVHDKLVSGKEDAFISKDLVTIYKEVNVDHNFDSIKIKKENPEDLINIYNDLEFYSFLKDNKKESVEVKYKIVTNVNEINISGSIGVYLATDSDNYHKCQVFGMGLYNDSVSLFVPLDILQEQPSFLTTNIKYIYDLKKAYVALKYLNINISNTPFDLMIAGYLLNKNIKNDLAYLANSMGYEIPFEDKKETLSIEEIARRSVLKAKFIYDHKVKIYNELLDENMEYLFNNIEMPLSTVLARMELNGIRVDKNVLEKMGAEIKKKIEVLASEIYTIAGMEFNISSPKQLGEVLFDKLGLAHGKKNKIGYTTDNNTLTKLIGIHPIIEKIIDYRTLTKLDSTYVTGILNSVASDSKIHTIYTQTLTKTGRLSSIEPNLQNIPIRYEEGRQIRKCFVKEKDSILISADYSQIELRIFAHMSKEHELIEAFNKGMDIHTKTAMDIFHVLEKDVTKEMRRKAKAVNFGILYGISGYGLSEDLHISIYEAKGFIDHYLECYPHIKEYMDECIKEVHELGCVKTLMNRKRVIEEINNKNYMIRSMGERMALNAPIQGTCADILKKAMIEIDQFIQDNHLKSTMLLQIHDELVFDVKLNELELIQNKVKEIMESTYQLDVPLIVDIELGNNLYEAK